MDESSPHPSASAATVAPFDPTERQLAAPATMSRAQVERTYRRYAPVYDLLFGASLGPGRRAMTRLVGSLAPAHVLEVGVGTGLTLAHYPRSAQVTGIDISPHMLAAARRRLPDGDSDRVDLRAMDAEDMDFADGTFDCVTLPYVLSVTPNPERLVAEVRRVCRRGGHIVLVNHFSGQRPWRTIETVLRPLAGSLGFRTEFSLEQHVLRHGWEVVSIEPANLLALSRLVHIRNV